MASGSRKARYTRSAGARMTRWRRTVPVVALLALPGALAVDLVVAAMMDSMLRVCGMEYGLSVGQFRYVAQFGDAWTPPRLTYPFRPLSAGLCACAREFE